MKSQRLVYLSKSKWSYIAEYKELEIADVDNLSFPEPIKVIKRSGKTGDTEGHIADDSFSICIDQRLSRYKDTFGSFYFFNNCFAIDSNSKSLIDLGESGSKVLTKDKTKPKALGIAFAKLLLNERTVVCRIDEIVRAFNLNLYDTEEENDL